MATPLPDRFPTSVAGLPAARAVEMAHCHIAEHHETGMMFSFTVAPSTSGGE